MASLLDLPDEVLLAILTHLSIADIGRTAQVCRRLSHLIGQDAVWRPISKNLVNIHEEEDETKRCTHYRTGRRYVSLKEKCRISLNWSTGHKRDILLCKFKTRYLPWLQLDGQHLYSSQGDKVHCFRLSDHGHIFKKPVVSFLGQSGDVSRFVVRNGNLLTSGCDGKMLLYHKHTGALLGCYQPDHRLPSCVNFTSVDMTDDVVIGGLNDQCIHLWSLHSQQSILSIPVLDRVWSVHASPSQSSFASGNAGTADHQPLKIWDIENGRHILSVGSNWRHGAGILHMQYESPDTLLSCGYDTAVRMWDLRTSCQSPVIELEDPHDYTVYRLQSDGKYLIASGTALWSVVRLWDKRMTKTLQSFFVDRRSNSPVYSLQFNGSHMYVALNTSLRALSFAAN
ncbi:F-box/WD repeat-containing protein 4-like isoform X2 [Acanthaster planci]|uniref:F-box/WD repeat-containing protein 4-like isoform X2 n=1 Tax=Acanthaster planci TaxID=133434 RepID=A0A8B7YZX5_ACAPL|nr:F-box/WD repeat-containing protein 4-like isoform X2 [Acanthaster planci]